MGAFDNFNPSKGGAFDNFTPPAASGDIAQPGDDTLGNMGWLDPRAANASTKDFVLAHLGELGKGLSQMGGTAADYARVAANTYGLGDSLTASTKALYGDATGNTQGTDYLSNLAAAKAATAAASARLGTAGNIAASMTGGGPLAELASGAGSAITPLVGGNRWLGGVLGSAAVGGGSTAAGEVGRNEAVSPWDIGVGTALGAAGGVPGGVVDRGGALAPPISADDLHAAARQIYKPLDNIIFDAKSEVHPELDAFKTAIGNTTDLTGKRLDQAKGTSAILDDLYGTPQLTGRNIQEAQRSLDKIAASQSSSVQDQEYAPKLKAALGNVMDNGLPFAGVPAGNQASGYAGLVQKAGDLIHGRAKDVDNLETMVAKSESGNKPDLGAQMGAYMNSKSGMNFIKPGTPQYDAANVLSQSAQAPLTSGQGLTMWDLKHHLMWPAIGLGGAGALSLTGTEEGHQPAWAQIPEDIAGLGAGFLLKNRLAAAGMKGQQQALAAARTAFSTGQAQAPVLPAAPFRDAVRQLIFGQGAAGQLPGQN
jgi:hypothetical protein